MLGYLKTFFTGYCNVARIAGSALIMKRYLIDLNL